MLRSSNTARSASGLQTYRLDSADDIPPRARDSNRRCGTRYHEICRCRGNRRKRPGRMPEVPIDSERRLSQRDPLAVLVEAVRGGRRAGKTFEEIIERTVLLNDENDVLDGCGVRPVALLPFDSASLRDARLRMTMLDAYARDDVCHAVLTGPGRRGSGHGGVAAYTGQRNNGKRESRKLFTRHPLVLSEQPYGAQSSIRTLGARAFDASSSWARPVSGASVDGLVSGGSATSSKVGDSTSSDSARRRVRTPLARGSLSDSFSAPPRRRPCSRSPRRRARGRARGSPLERQRKNREFGRRVSQVNRRDAAARDVHNVDAGKGQRRRIREHERTRFELLRLTAHPERCPNRGREQADR